MRILRRIGWMAVIAVACRDDGTLAPPAALSGGAPASLTTETVVMVGAGDIASCATTGDEATARLLDSIPGTVFTTGDNVYPHGSDEDFANCFASTWGRHKARIRPAVGNHEYDIPRAAGYFNYYGAAAGDPAGGYYSYDLGAWHVVVLNSILDASAGSPQMQWLRNDLAASPAHCTVAIWHHPRFSSGTTHGSSFWMQPAWQALYDAGTELVLNSHEHHYERFAPQDAAGARDTSFGMREFVVGTGGGGGGYPFAATPLATSEVRDNATNGVLKLTLDTVGYAWEFVPEAGKTFRDVGTGRCHDAPPTAPNAAPAADAGGPYASTDGTVRFDGTRSSDPDGNLPLTYRWDFGDGNVTDGARPIHAYLADGTYQVSLTVADARGAPSATTVTQVTVTRPAGAPVVFSGAANIATCAIHQDEATAALIDSLPGFVFALGDNAFPKGTSTAYVGCYHPNWGRDRTRTYPVLGNHEYDTGEADGAFGYFGARLGEPDHGYYSFDLGAWHVIVLNDNGTFVSIGAGSAQEQWLKADLAASPRRCTLALWHQPRFFSSNSAGFTSRTGSKAVWNDLYAAGADLVVNGHQHHYERLRAMNPDGGADASYGIRSFNIGTGGESIELPTVAIHPNSDVRSATYGVFKLTLGDDRYDWEFIPVAGQAFRDAGSGFCHPAPGAANQAPVAAPGGPYTSSDGAVQFDGSASTDPDADLPLTYQWDFGDGATADGPRPAHTYVADGAYAVTLTVTDARGAPSAPAQAQVTVARGNAPVLLSGAGNIGTCGSNANDEATARLLDSLPGFVFTLGDNAYPKGAAADYTGCYQPTWGRHLGRTYPVLGNHDYDLGTADGAFGYFGARLGEPGKGFYSFDLGAWHVVVLNDNAATVPFSAGSAQEQWLRADLAANTKRCTLALWHQPRFFSSSAAGYISRSAYKILWDDLYAAGAELVVNGHQYHYERLAPMAPDGTADAARGLREFNVGTGGNSLALPTVAIHPNSEVRAAVYGVLKLTLREDAYDWEFVPIAGQTFGDSGSGSCH